ncbi:unnamed protein product [Polarella glacialis]|uniref:Uncharacterized protein n=1 Tax=Polarella glacialis TaxID=89957 RepID=A0A813EPU9_POLGL|nr:unnamed protein product [Polarella glacialis]
MAAASYVGEVQSDKGDIVAAAFTSERRLPLRRAVAAAPSQYLDLAMPLQASKLCTSELVATKLRGFFFFKQKI